MSERPEQPDAKAKAKEPARSEERFLATVSPHIHARDDIPRVMWTVVVALLPALFAACYFFAFSAVQIVLIAVVSAVATEAAVQKLTGRKITVSDGSAVVTGLLVAFVTPSNAPWFIPLIASVFAVALVKQAFGGLGCNIWNPALAGRAFALACFAGLMTGGWVGSPAQPDADPPVRATPANWVAITPGQRFDAEGYSRADTETGIDAMTGASALSARKDYLRSVNTTAAELANRGECAETSAGSYDVTRLPEADRNTLRKALGTTPRGTLRRVQALNNTPLIDLFLGAQVGSVGETSALALIIGGVILLVTRTIRWYIPVSFIGTVALFGWLLPVGAWAYDPASGVLGHGLVWCGGRPLFAILSGGVVLGAIFMATDMVTSPLSRTGKLIFGVGCGLLTVIIRKYGGYPEGVCYSILLMNTATPLIDSLTKPRVYGRKR